MLREPTGFDDDMRLLLPTGQMEAPYDLVPPKQFISDGLCLAQLVELDIPVVSFPWKSLSFISVPEPPRDQCPDRLSA